MSPEQLCRHIIRFIYAPIHIYDAEGELLSVIVDHGEQEDLFEADAAFRAELLGKARAGRPFLHMEHQCILYGVVPSPEGNTYIIGPCCLLRTARESAAYLAERHGLDRSRPFRISEVPLGIFCETAAMLYEQLTGTALTGSELLRLSYFDERFEQEMKLRLSEVLYENRESGYLHNPYAQEEREQKAVYDGDLDALERSFRETFVGRYGTLSRDPIRQVRDMCIVVITLASRSAIQAGLLPELAFSMSDAFIQRTEEMTDIAEIFAAGRQAEIEFCRAVHDLRQRRDGLAPTPPLLNQCKGLIAVNLHQPLTVQALAEQLDVSPRYLSRSFQKYENMKLGDYIAREKIEAAKERLIYSDVSFREIAATYGFSSQSHFGQVFKRWTGMTPGQFREAHRVKSGLKATPHNSPRTS